jgi:hypothetical protein
MKNYTKIITLNPFIKKVKKEAGIDLFMIYHLRKNAKGTYIIPDNCITLDDSNGHTIHTYGRDRELNKKFHAYLKKAGYKVCWVNVHGGHKVSIITRCPTEFKVLFES